MAIFPSFGAHIFPSPSTMFPKPWRVGIDLPLRPEYSPVCPHHFDELWVTALTTAHCRMRHCNEDQYFQWMNSQTTCTWNVLRCIFALKPIPSLFPILLFFLFSYLSAPSVYFAKWPFLVVAWYSNPMKVFIPGCFVTFVKKHTLL